MRLNRKTALFAWKASLPVMAGYVVLGAGFGILMHTRGYAWYWSALMSILIYAGSMQYVAIDLLGAGAGLVTCALMTVAVNARHLFYGLTMLGTYRNAGRAKPYLIFALTDETFSLVCAADLPEGVDLTGYEFLVSLFDQCYWVAGSLLGAVLGSALPFRSDGVEFSMTALFTVVMLEQWEKAENHVPALAGLMISFGCRLVFGASDFLIPAMLLITAFLLAEHALRKEAKADA